MDILENKLYLFFFCPFYREMPYKCVKLKTGNIKNKDEILVF